jgi:hypothetical protein
VGGHLGSGTWRLDAAYQLYGPTDPRAEGWAGSVIAAYNKGDTGLLGSLLDKVKGNVARKDYDVLFVTGNQIGDWARFYTGARYMYSSWTLEVLPDLPIDYGAEGIQQKLLGTDTSGGIHHFGGVVGGALGYKHAFVGAELNVVRYQGSAQIFFKERDLTGVAFMPAVFLYGQY